MSGLDQKGTYFPNGVNVDKGELFIAGVAVMADAASLNRAGGSLSGTVTFDPPSLTTGAFATSSEIPVAGIALGDRIDLYPPYSTQGIMYQATPSSAGNMIINLSSCSSATVDLASGTWGFVVSRRS